MPSIRKISKPSYAKIINAQIKKMKREKKRTLHYWMRQPRIERLHTKHTRAIQIILYKIFVNTPCSS